MARLACTLVTVLLLTPACALDDAGTFLAAESAGESVDPIAEEDDLAPSSLLDCELEIPCEFPYASQTHDAAAGLVSLGDNDRCIFTTLARGEPALVETVAEFSDATAFLDYVVVGEGLALRQASGQSEAGGRWQNGVFACELRPGEFFAQCLKAPSELCLDPEQWVVGCQPLDNLVCPG